MEPTGDTIMSFQIAAIVQTAADKVGVFVLLALGLAMGGVTAVAGL